ncbi:hypothetical protein FACS189494_09540 [Spirochaetia bacterium]|nr:hypothetical protein FACS189494_09540 [Spirochaetia bacterium]
MGSASGLPYRTNLEVPKAPLHLPQYAAKEFLLNKPHAVFELKAEKNVFGAGARLICYAADHYCSVKSNLFVKIFAFAYSCVIIIAIIKPIGGEICR